MYKDTITLFNRYNGEWIPTVLHNVDLNADRGAIMQTYGASSTDNAKLHLEVKDGKVDNHPVLSPKEYAGEGITFRSGNDFDFFWHGVWEAGVQNETDYPKGFYDYMRRMYDGVYAITSVAVYSVIPHYEILAK